MIEAGLNTLLSNDPALQGIIGQCLYPLQLPEQPTYPCVTYQVISAQSDYATDGTSVRWLRLQFDAWGSSYLDCKRIVAALDQVLDSFRGTLSDGTVILGSFRDFELDRLDQQYSRVFRTIVEYTMHYRGS